MQPSAASVLLTARLSKKGWSPSELGVAIGLTRAMVGYLLNGKRKPSLATALRIAEIFPDITPAKWEKQAPQKRR